MNLQTIRHARMFLDRPFIQNDFIFRALISILLDEDVITEKELGQAIGEVGDEFSIVRAWASGESSPSPMMRLIIFEWLREKIDEKLLQDHRD